MSLAELGPISIGFSLDAEGNEETRLRLLEKIDKCKGCAYRPCGNGHRACEGLDDDLSELGKGPVAGIPGPTIIEPLG